MPFRPLISSRVVDRETVRSGEFPYMASIYPKGYLNSMGIPMENWCSGAILNEEWVLTAANCFDNKTYVERVRVYVWSTEWALRQELEVARLIVHEHWNASTEDGRRYDIALIRLLSKIDIDIIKEQKNNRSYYIANSVCLPVLNITSEHELAVFSGWVFANINDTKKRIELKKTQYNIVGSNGCDKRLVCGLQSQHMACYGDVGSPLVQWDDNRAVIIGLLSRVGNGCDANKQHFTRVSYFVEWITSTIKDNNGLTSESLGKESNSHTITTFFVILLIVSLSLTLFWFITKNKRDEYD